MKRVSKRSGGTPELREERQNGCPSPLLLSRTPLKGRIKHFSELAATQSGRRDRERRRKGVRWSGLKVELIRGKGSDERNGMIFFHPPPRQKNPNNKEVQARLSTTWSDGRHKVRIRDS